MKNKSFYSVWDSRRFKLTKDNVFAHLFELVSNKHTLKCLSGRSELDFYCDEYIFDYGKKTYKIYRHKETTLPEAKCTCSYKNGIDNWTSLNNLSCLRLLHNIHNYLLVPSFVTKIPKV